MATWKLVPQFSVHGKLTQRFVPVISRSGKLTGRHVLFISTERSTTLMFVPIEWATCKQSGGSGPLRSAIRHRAGVRVPRCSARAQRTGRYFPSAEQPARAPAVGDTSPEVTLPRISKRRPAPRSRSPRLSDRLPDDKAGSRRVRRRAPDRRAWTARLSRWRRDVRSDSLHSWLSTNDQRCRSLHVRRRTPQRAHVTLPSASHADIRGAVRLLSGRERDVRR